MKPPSRPIAYVLTIAVVGLAGFVRWLLNPVLGDYAPFVTFFIAVLVASWLGGLRTGLLAVLLSTLVALHFFVPPSGALVPDLSVHVVGVAAYLVAGVGIALFSEAMYATRRRFAAQEERLRITLASIGDGVITTDAKGIITSLNDVAMSLTGRKDSEVAGQPLAAALRIVTHEGGHALQDPVTRAQQEGPEGRCAQRALLVAADGRQRRIEFSVSPIRSAAESVAGHVLIMRDITDLERAEEAVHGSETALARELARMARLQALSTTIAHAGDFSALLQEILTASSDLTGTDKGNIQLVAPDTGNLRIVVHQGLGRRLLEHFAERGWDATCGAAHRLGQRVIVEDITQEPSVQGTVELEIVLEDGIRAIQSTPLVSRDGRFLGMLNNYYREVHRPPASDLRILDLLARMAADFIERSQAEQALREADRRKDEFLAVLSHELRNPLAPVMNAMHILRFPRITREMRESAIEMVGRQVAQLARLIDDLLHVSRITSGKIELKKQRVDLGQAAAHAIEAARSASDPHTRELSVVLPPQPLYLQADPARLQQILGNLLSNALKFTGPGGRVALTAESEEGMAVIRVKDDGIGIAREDLARVFEMFVQADATPGRFQAGLGIGLSLVKVLVQLHGGTVAATSDGPGRGTEVVVRLPLGDDAEIAASSQPPVTTLGRREIQIGNSGPM
jgi:PAS domain S-box-containing protein